MTIKVFIVDDHYMVIEGIRSLLQHETAIELVGHAMSADSCISFLRQQQPDVILMDINLAEKSGIELCAEVKKQYPGIFILGLSTFNQQSFIRKMMDNGASGYVLKNVTREELVEGISTIVKGKIYLSHEAARSLRASEESDVPVLTRREQQVLSLIAEGLTNNEVAEKLFISTTTVDTHRKSLLAKLNARNTASLIRIATQLQLI
ncbi:response regulator transcription factor [Paraflavitalea sp. CAU 1676]|uniref:response regulator n=1 Tax=Paraflavitalea sp. CAU 1676 TaxID=3032598 RepID=UPI0023DBCF1F|nr:response regulator transcription factor [Paraflavitalea sp. CAU 1676]MDF2193710.1 response regulator transcription factor [Paraflavitalea sp. CAU 1676]